MRPSQKLCECVFWQVKYISLLLNHGGAHLLKSAPRLFISMWQSSVHHEVSIRSDYHGQMTQLFRQESVVGKHWCYFRPPCGFQMNEQSCSHGACRLHWFKAMYNSLNTIALSTPILSFVAWLFVQITFGWKNVFQFMHKNAQGGIL